MIGCFQGVSNFHFFAGFHGDVRDRELSIVLVVFELVGCEGDAVDRDAEDLRRFRIFARGRDLIADVDRLVDAAAVLERELVADFDRLIFAFAAAARRRTGDRYFRRLCAADAGCRPPRG